MFYIDDECRKRTEHCHQRLIHPYCTLVATVYGLLAFCLGPLLLALPVSRRLAGAAKSHRKLVTVNDPFCTCHRHKRKNVFGANEIGKGIAMSTRRITSIPER